MPTSIDGLISGLNTTDTITQLMAVERQSQTRLASKRTANETILSTYQLLNSRMLAVKDLSATLATASGWQLSRASSTDVTLATATAASTASTGSLTFRIARLAASEALVSTGSVTSTSAVVATPGSKYLVSAASSLGFSKLTGSSDLTTGAHNVEVVQSSTGATVQSHVLGTTITLLPNTVIEVATDGSAATTQTIALTGGTYSRDELAAHIAAVSGGTLRAGFTNDGRLELSTTREGSAARLAVTGGTAIAALGLDVSGAASTGTDGIVKVDDIATTVSDLAPGGSATLAAGGGASLSATFQSGLRVGTVKAMNVDLGDGQLSTVATAINSAAAGLRATTVQVSPGTYRLQLAATASGLAGRMTADTSVFDTAFGGMSILSAAQDSKLTVGTGAASFSVSSSDNRVETLPGVIISLNKADPLTDVTITVSNDADAIASKVGAMIDSVNGTLSFIASQSRYDASTKTGGPLLSDSTARSMQSRLYDVFGTIGAKAASFGITLGKDATIQFDRAKFVAAYQLNPSSAQTAFTAPTVGIATRLADVGTKATESVTGILSSAITGKQTLSKSFTNQIASWDTRLTLRENGLRRTFSNLEVTLGKLKSQSAWLAGQITSLRTFK